MVSAGDVQFTGPDSFSRRAILSMKGNSLLAVLAAANFLQDRNRHFERKTWAKIGDGSPFSSFHFPVSTWEGGFCLSENPDKIRWCPCKRR
jgi:hypothetical protein